MIQSVLVHIQRNSSEIFNIKIIGTLPLHNINHYPIQFNSNTILNLTLINITTITQTTISSTTEDLNIIRTCIEKGQVLSTMMGTPFITGITMVNFLVMSLEGGWEGAEAGVGGGEKEIGAVLRSRDKERRGTRIRKKDKGRKGTGGAGNGNSKSPTKKNLKDSAVVEEAQAVPKALKACPLISLSSNTTNQTRPLQSLSKN